MTTDNFAPVITRTIMRGMWQYSVTTQIDGEQLSVILPVGQWGYGAVIAAIIRSRYSDDDALAITLNMQSLLANCCDCPAEKQEEHRREFVELTAWREKARVAAKAVMAAWSE